MRIKPEFAALAKANDNENLVFCTVNTQQAQDAAQAYQVSAIPNFIAFRNGNQIENFKGADSNKLRQLATRLAGEIPKNKKMTAKRHDSLEFKVFKPTHLAPQVYQNVANLEKMKEVIQKYVDSETVQKEVGSVDAFRKWLNVLDLS